MRFARTVKGENHSRSGLLCDLREARAEVAQMVEMHNICVGNNTQNKANEGIQQRQERAACRSRARKRRWSVIGCD